ncbi:MAG: hypothetical protein A3D96_00980 [Chlamydiae bacterium RIFCSPHIGHO2_12_FULL_44_59]|nr:MAG: hypothetical protein A2796_00555 [Chlamydiae bacterium RIFCSPHIGHO2_01_FULL_44_39]OGN57259.1 MAG: hypothetical protein A3C42_04400 [Chlamydiae bacterium RIFCSPHIGHO2_02_FULL_45_9]OGN60444.1 MAG: hypothetical protein A3D96_00980 [Chlamydiae bacterium RIFCSPHIGHO2_12_FULL_44_59]OGN66565.1 MAG: hypothetical protein A2978_05165 [Chlamydiae bacterium RIFCSPLOWO2_01_FULL_44_52]OGN69814.1 MAG: hypothetical protein A3I67_06920 [Chlamydiae bacterium RIFCSPLOWO2_02_FULL_45_22]OGN70354.1 MAG: hyp
MREKKTFLLLEVLMAFFLVCLCAIPLVTGPLKLYRQQTAHFIDMEKERLADWTFCEIKEMLFNQEIPWEKIPAKGESSLPFSLSPAILHVPNCQAKTISRAFVLTGRGEKINKTEKQEEIVRQLGIYVLLDSKRYAFRLPVTKKSRQKI